MPLQFLTFWQGLGTGGAIVATRRTICARLGQAVALVGSGLAVSAGVALHAQAQTYLILRSAGPSAWRYPSGTKVSGETRIKLVRGDTVHLLGPLGSRTLSGPGEYRPVVPPHIAPRRGSDTQRVAFSATRFVGPPPQVSAYAEGVYRLADELGSACRGYVGREPSVQLQHRATSAPLTMRITNGEKSLGRAHVFAVNDPDGGWHCSHSRDAQGLPFIQFRTPVSGVYDVWIGTEEPTRRSKVVLQIEDE